MADLVPRGGPECTLETLPIDTTVAKKKGFYRQVPIFTEWLPYLGQIFLLWGSFEGSWNTFLEMMFLATGKVPHKKWKRLTGQERHRLFTEQVDRTFATDTAINKYLHEMVSDSIILQQKRNVLLHGVVHIVMGPDPHMVAEGTAKDGSPEKHELREADIKMLFYELSHLAGRFMPLTPPFPSSPIVSSGDKFVLQELWSKAHSNLPDPEKLKH